MKVRRFLFCSCFRFNISTSVPQYCKIINVGWVQGAEKNQRGVHRNEAPKAPISRYRKRRGGLGIGEGVSPANYVQHSDTSFSVL